jgi:iron(III) transport system substrate-binding protein
LSFFDFPVQGVLPLLEQVSHGIAKGSVDKGEPATGFFLKRSENMGQKVGGWVVSLLFAAFLLTVPANLQSASLPKSSEAMLKKLKLESSILADLDKELQVPKDWIDKARREGKLRVLTTPVSEREKEMLSPFKERYPFIVVDLSGSSQEERTIKTLVAFKAGRIVTDVLTSVGGYFYAYKDANALEDLRAIPGLKNTPEGAKDPNGLWAGVYTLYWCMAYNTRLVKKEELPKRWEDLLTNPKWREGNLALGNRPQLWAPQLWKVKGENWTKDFLTKLLTEVRPQLRKEGMNALQELLAPGEFHAVIPAWGTRTQQKVLEGAPLGFICPEPVPVSVNEAVILKGAPNMHAARIFINWLLSKEGQIAQYASSYITPVHKDLMRPEFIPFSEQILGKEMSFRDPGLEVDVVPQLTDFWNNLWMRSSRGK